MHQLSNSVNRKFDDIINVDDWEIETDTGWTSITHLCKTIPYDVWEIASTDHILRCADDHILFDENMNEKFAKNFKVGDLIITRAGPWPVSKIEHTKISEHMFDIRVDHPNHRFWSGEFLSHNTSIINAITYALFNKPFDNISLQKLINGTNSQKKTQMEVRLSFEKDGHEYEIVRQRGESFGIQVSCDGEDITLDSVSANDDLVSQIIGISYELFANVVVFSGNSTPFLQLPISQQRSQIEELFNITLLTEKATELKKLIAETNSAILIQQAIIKEQESQNSLIEQQIKNAKGRVEKWEQERENQIASLEHDLEKVATIDIEKEKETHILVDEASRYVDSLRHDKTAFSKDHQLVKNAITKLISEISHLQNQHCPYCHQTFVDSQTKLHDSEMLKEEKVLREVELQEKVNELSSEISEYEDTLASLKSSLKFKSLSEAVKTEQNASTAKKRIEELRNSDNPYEEQFNILKNTMLKEIKTDEIDQLTKLKEHQAFLQKLLTDKNSFIRRRIINQTIPFLNSRIIEYTRILGLPHIVKFDDDMSCTVSEYDRELDFGNLSSGEKKRVNMALALAFRDVLHHLHAKVNCMFIDEIDQSLDSVGVDSMFKLLKSKCREDEIALWIISHRPEAIGRFDRMLTVKKQNGFSQIIEDEEDAELE
jgi:adenosyl cobinamide kinase/adenosyl cobinamide phosphate guanylyltransferase